MVDQKYLKTADAAKYLGITEYILLRYAKQGKVQYSRPGGKQLLFDVNDLDKFMQDHRGK